MPSNKQRLYVGLSIRNAAATMSGNEDAYQWALLTSPKGEQDDSRGVRYCVKDQLNPTTNTSEWVYDKANVRSRGTSDLLVRVLVAKVTDMKRLENVLDHIPVKQGDEKWNAVEWTKHALAALEKDGKVLGTSRLEWKTIRDFAMGYVERKKQQKRWEAGSRFNVKDAATYDLLEENEIVE